MSVSSQMFLHSSEILTANVRLKYFTVRLENCPHENGRSSSCSMSAISRFLRSRRCKVVQCLRSRWISFAHGNRWHAPSPPSRAGADRHEGLSDESPTKKCEYRGFRGFFQRKLMI